MGTGGEDKIGKDGPGEVEVGWLLDFDVEEDEGVCAYLGVLCDAVVKGVGFPRVGEEDE